MSANGEEKTFANQPSNEQYGSEAGKSLLQSTESIVRFKINKDEVVKGTDKCRESSEFKLNDVAWKVKVCQVKVGEESEQIAFASVELEAVFKDETATWSCEAEAEVKLIDKDGKHKVDKIASFTYSAKNNVNSNGKFIEWDDIKGGFLVKDTATFEFNVKTKSLNRSSKLEQTTAKFMLRLKQIDDKLSEYSNELTVRGIRWRAYATKIGEYFAIFVEANENDIDTEAQWAVTTNFKLLSTIKNGKAKERNFKDKPFDWTQTNRGFKKFLEWSEFMKEDKGFVRNNAALVEITLEIKPKTS